jgi:hypothetical protein
MHAFSSLSLLYFQRSFSSTEFSIISSQIAYSIPGVVSVQWIPLVTDQNRKAFESELLASKRLDSSAFIFNYTDIGYGLSKVPDGSRDEYYPM